MHRCWLARFLVCVVGAVAADRVFVAETKDQKLEVVRALDRETGRQLWMAEWLGAMTVPFMAKRNGDWIRSPGIVPRDSSRRLPNREWNLRRQRSPREKCSLTRPRAMT